MEALGPVTCGDTIPTSSSWPIVVTRSSSPTSAPREATGRNSSTPGTRSGHGLDAERPHRRREVPDRSGYQRSQAGRDLRRLLWRIRDARGRDLHPRALCLRDSLRRPFELDHADRVVPGILETAPQGDLVPA